MILTLFRIGLALIPFTCFSGLPGLGELQRELSAHVFLVALFLASFTLLSDVSRGRVEAPSFRKIYGLPILFAVVMGVVLLSFVANFPSIKEASFQGRGGLGKFVTSSLVVVYGFGLATLTYALAGRQAWGKLIVKPLSVSVAICAAFSVLEIGSQYVAPIAGFYKGLSAIIHSGIEPPAWDLRLRSVAFEPPDFANTAGYIWPWLLGAMQFSKGKDRLWFAFLWAVLNVMIVLSEARTSLVVISGLLAVFVGLRAVYLPLKAPRDPKKNIALANFLFVLLLPVLFLIIGLNVDDIVRNVVTGDRVSNLSRLASMTSALRMFADRPFFGFGFGQFGFHAAQYMPSWGFLSYEVRDWLYGPEGFWPAVYSVYARFGADMGLVGIAMWIGVWLYLARAVLLSTIAHRQATGELPAAAYSLIMGCFCVLLAGVPNDSVRAPMIWINMGLVCRYLQDMRLAKEARVLAAQQKLNKGEA